MSSFDRLDILREQNKALLAQLQQHREKLNAVSHGFPNRKRGREAEAEESSESQEVITLTEGDRGPARAALAKPSVTFSDTVDHKTSSKTSENRADSIKHTASKSVSTKTCLKDQNTVHSEETHLTDSHHSQPLLGYDWIAGVIDAEDSLIERPDEFFNDLSTFRSLNKNECVHSLNTGFSEETNSTQQLLSENDRLETDKDTHQCTFSYRINSRLFPVPLHSQECCPVCKKHKSDHPHTAAEPALVRVSIPQSTLLPPYKHKTHRRCSFDPSDSLALPSHCLAGWSNKSQSTLAPQSNLDLRSSLDTNTGTENKELVDLSAFKVSSNQKPQQIPHVSLLTRHNFQHISPFKRK